MSGPRKAVEGVRAAAVVVGGSLLLLLAAGRCVGATVRALARGLLPSLPAAVGTAALVAYAGPLRRWMQSWGAPGEGTTTEPVHAIEVDAPAEEVWPWLAQLGQDRGGFYSYEWLENLAGLAPGGCPQQGHQPHDSPLYTAYYVGLIELPHFVMERRMLLGIKERAERAALHPPDRERRSRPE